MITFAIDREKREKLNQYLDEIGQILYSRDSIEAVFGLSYIVHKNLNDIYYNLVAERDGINIMLNYVDSQIDYAWNNKLKELIERIYEDTGINVILNPMSHDTFMQRMRQKAPASFHKTLGTSTMLFCRDAEINSSQLRAYVYFSEPYENAVKYEPPLTLKKWPNN